MSNDNGRTDRIAEVAETMGVLMWRGHRQSTVAAEHLGLTLPQQSVLQALEAAGGRSTMSDLGRLTHQNLATLTGVVDRLIKTCLVERVRDENDRRVVHVVLTAAGRARMVEARAARAADISGMLQTFSADEIAAFDHLLRKFIAGMAALTGTTLPDVREPESAAAPHAEGADLARAPIR